MTPDDILNDHVALCDETYQMLNNENSILKSQGKLGKAQLEQKKELLRKLDSSLDALKRLNSNPHSKSTQTTDLIDRAQKRLMQIFLLDRENERLLNKSAGTTTSANRNIRKRNLSTYAENAAQAEQAYAEPEPLPSPAEPQIHAQDNYDDGQEYYSEEEYEEEEYEEDDGEYYQEETDEDGLYTEDDPAHTQNAYPDYDEDPAPPTPPPQSANPPRKLPRAYRQHIQGGENE